MKSYTYWDNSKGWHAAKQVFACTANCIGDADVLFKEATGIDVYKAPYIGCRVEAISEFQNMPPNCS